MLPERQADFQAQKCREMTQRPISWDVLKKSFAGAIRICRFR
ncbi:hypothetical protein NSND_50486 [Nitrospira sp. ND1]|jgi:hypothetical protein|nr:hypothetical protein NSND_50486 [Nitrospira sp. ND1]